MQKKLVTFASLKQIVNESNEIFYAYKNAPYELLINSYRNINRKSKLIDFSIYKISKNIEQKFISIFHRKLDK